MNKDVTRQWANVIATVVTIVINTLANALPINGRNTGEISDSFQVYFVPAGYVFAIWGLIYVALVAFTIYQALPSQRENPLLRRIGYWYVIGSAANSAWIFFWHYGLLPLTLVAMLILLVSLIAIYVRLGIGKWSLKGVEKWVVHVPFSIYLGWITVATVANVTSLLYDIGWGGWGIGPVAWAAIMLVVATIVAGLMSLTRGDVAYIAVIVWAFVGIAIKFPDVLAVSITAGLMAVVAVAALVWAYPRVRAKRVTAS